MNTCALAKSELRQQMLHRLKQLTTQAKAADSAIITAKFHASTAYQQAKNIFAYLSMKDEVQILPLLEQMLQEGKMVSVPLITGRRTMQPVRLFSLAALVPGKYGILTVKADSRSFVKPDELECILVPGLAFDCQGGRLGRGGGFYDSFLPLCTKAVKIALAYEVQLVDKVPMEAEDYRVDKIITPDTTISCVQ